ncbi:MAG TPA: YraN family protein [Spirochaetota bacterium]|nr:YraN family protein [Spirochaetota bacterium]HPS88162.1 YraN family protein [Spirochaetota bacterium]
MPQGYRKILGAEGESAACTFLEAQGFSVINKNFYAGRSGEIDVIAVKDKLVVFAEVKARNSEMFGGGIYSITDSKKKKLRASAKYYLLKNPQYNSPEFNIRFDLIIVKDGKVEWIDDIIR